MQRLSFVDFDKSIKSYICPYEEISTTIVGDDWVIRCL